MSDDEGTKKQTGYRLEYASSGRAKCSGPKPCSGSSIGKGELRLGTLLDYNGNKSFKWRHWGCTTARILSNFKNQFDAADDLDGFEDLNDGDKDRVRKAWAEGHVAEEDIPATARKDGDEEAEEEETEEQPKKRAPAKKVSSVIDRFLS
ncbi:zf-PARP-domain-containing protein [Rhizoctonia solani]|nr:zf-PARP-domain-containing protein [Rhizoctonia solani]